MSSRLYLLEKEMATHSSVLACRIPGTGGSLVGCHLWGHTESDMTEIAVADIILAVSLVICGSV